MSSGKAYSSGHQVSSLLWTCICSNCSDQFSWNCRVFSRLFKLKIYRYFLDFALMYECFILRAMRLRCKLLKKGYFAERLKSSFRKCYRQYGDLIDQYEVSFSRMLNVIPTLDKQWLPNRSDFQPISWPDTELDLHRIMSGFHGAFATGVACQQGTLTLPGTWFRPPFWDLHAFQFLRPDSSNLSCFYSTFHLEYPMVLCLY